MKLETFAIKIPQEIKYFVLVKTYPNPSRKYIESSCSIGIMEFNKKRFLIRIYPILYRFLDDEKKFRKFSWLKIKIIRNPKDSRKESFKLYNFYDIKILDEIKVTGKNDINWKHRMELIIPFVKPYRQIIENKASLGIIKPQKILNFVWEQTDPQWTEKEIKKLQQIHQGKLFNNNLKNLHLLEKIPYKFYYIFQDELGKEHKMQITDWEIYQLFRKLKKKYLTNKVILDKIKNKYFHELPLNREVYFILGNHFRFRNKFFITGVLYPPKNWKSLKKQKSFF